MEAKGKKTDLEQVHDHVPLAAIANELVGEILDEAVVDGELGVLDGKFEVVVGLVQLVPEEEVRLPIKIPKLAHHYL